MKNATVRVLMLVSLLISLQGAAYAVSQCISGDAHLTVTKTGTGDGTVSTGSGGAWYCKDTTKTAYPTAVADAYSTFTGWSIDCSGSASPTSVSMNTDRTCMATFTCNYYYMIDGTIGANYASIQDAYYDLTPGATLDILGTSFSGNLTLDQDKAITLRGGFSCSFLADTGYSTISSQVIIAAGSATVEYLKIK